MPERTNPLRLLVLPSLVTEIATALWLWFEGLAPQATAEAMA